MTGDELIAALQALTPEQRQRAVITEGCDCVGDVGEISLRDDLWPEVFTEPGPAIFLARSTPF